MMRGKLRAATAGLAIAMISVPAGAKTDVPEIPFERYTLDNGLQVILHSDRRVPLVAVDIWYHVGSGDETAGKSGFAHLFEHMMFQGAKHIGKDVHFDLLRKVGASSVNGTTNKDRTNYFEVVPSHEIETALWLESDRMGYLLDLLDKASLDNQIDVVRNERRQRYDNVPFGKDRFAVAAALYPDTHPYRYLTIGRHEDIENADIDDVRAFFRKWYVPSNATITLAGDFAMDDGKKLVDKWFGAFPKLPKPDHVAPAAPTLAKTERTEIDDSLARYTRLHYVWPSPAKIDPGDAELSILASVLASAGWGRLHRKLVIEQQSAQRVSIYQNGNGFSGEFHVVVDVKPEHALSKVEPAVQAELDRVIADGVTQKELGRVVNRLEANFVWGLEEVLTRAERLQFFNHYAGDPGFTDQWLERYRSRTVDDVRKTAADVLGGPRVEVITRPKEGAS
jgi:predicted Zn-dependent peptidase